MEECSILTNAKLRLRAKALKPGRKITGLSTQPGPGKVSGQDPELQLSSSCQTQAMAFRGSRSTGVCFWP
jgi:hypothetical protein